jgi:hypothetical protein
MLPAGMGKAPLAKAHADLASLELVSAVAMAKDLNALGLQLLETIDIK